MILLGSVQRSKLEQLLHEHILEIHTKRQQAALGGTVAGAVSDEESPPHSPTDSAFPDNG